MSTLSKSNFEAQRNINLVFRREKTVGVYASVVTLANEKLITSTTLYTPPVVRYSLNIKSREPCSILRVSNRPLVQ